MELVLFYKYPNHIELNKLTKLFEPVLSFKDYDESHDDWYKIVTYIAKTDDNWTMTACFTEENELDKNAKYYYPSIEFEKNRDHTNTKKFKGIKRKPTAEEKVANKVQADAIIEHFQNVYNPNFDKAIEIIKTYLQQGLDIGLYNYVKLVPHDRHVKSQFYRYENDYDGHNRLFFNSSVLAKITFNNTLQTMRADERHFKKSHLSLDIVYLVSTDNEIRPYFKIKLPYSSHKKINCILSFDGEKMYFTKNDNELKKDFIDNLIEYKTDEANLEKVFRSEFKEEIISVIARTLKIKRNELKKMTEEELKNHFILIEMIKL